MTISMETFNWQVVATFFAAGGAVVVGWRQVGIADGQRSIAKEQANTAQNAIEIARAQARTASLVQRTALFDRRLSVYKVVKEYLNMAIYGEPSDLIAFSESLRDTLTEVSFLFDKKVENFITAAINAADEYSTFTTQHDMNEAGLFLKSPLDEAMEERMRDLRNQIQSTLKSLANNMGDEMRLFNDPIPPVIK